jgi:acyl transferase domain-containing protein
MEVREFQVTFTLEAVGDTQPAEAEDDLVHFVDALLERGQELALGPAGSVDGRVLELRFSVIAATADELYAKLRKVAKILAGDDYEVAATSATRERELALA